MEKINYELFKFPKNARVVNKKEISKKKHRCEYCRKEGTTHTHHIKTKGSGGNDTPDNLIELCPLCHDLVHRGNIKKEWLIEIKKGAIL